MFPVEDNGIPGSLNFENSRGRKKREKIPGVVRILMKFQGVQFLKMDILNRGYGIFLENLIVFS